MNEKITGSEVMSPQAADDYIRAACMVLSHIKDEVSGIKVTPPDPNYQYSSSKLGSLQITLDTENGIRYETGATDEPRRSFFVKQSRVDYSNTDLPIISVRLHGNPDSKRAEYRMMRSIPSKSAENLKGQIAHDNLITLVSDFKSALDQKLTDRPDVIDMIQWTQDDLVSQRQRHKAGRLAGRLSTKSKN